MPDPSPSAEKAVIGSALNSPTALDAVARIVRPDDFYVPAHETICTTVLALHEKGDPVDPITVSTALTRAGDLARVGGAPYLAELVGEGISPASASAHARIVRDEATLRRLTSAATRVGQMAKGGADTPDALVAAAIAEFEAAYRPSVDVDKTLIGDLVWDVIEDLDTTETMSGISWPYRDADRTLNPLTPGQLIIAAGRSGAGKSVLCVDVARHAALAQGKTVVLHSMEMGRAEIMLRIIAAEARVNLSSLQSKDLTEDQWQRVNDAANRFQGAPLHIVDNPQVTIASLKASIKDHKPDLLVIDYVQLATLNPKADRRQALEEFTRGLKLTAKAAGIPILTAAQLGRGPEMRQDHTPMLSDLRETGSLENDADTVLLLYRPDYYDKESPRAGELDLIIAKQRNGPTQTVPLVHQMHYSRIVDGAHP